MFPTNSRVNALALGEVQTGGMAARTENCSECGRKIERSIAYMAQHLGQPLQVADLAAQANVSPSHYFALFKQQTGHAPIDYFIRMKMQHARRLLDSTTASVKEIAEALGYDDPFYFSRVFKAVHNLPPSHYRNARVNLGDEIEGSMPPMSRSSLSEKNLVPA
jgi:AraC family transcriptional regulator, arabinose operon regulatory protein